MDKNNQSGNSDKTGSQDMWSRKRVYGESSPKDQKNRLQQKQPKLYERRDKYPSYSHHSHSERTAMKLKEN